MSTDRPQNDLISIVIPAKNEQDDIAETLERFLALDYEPKEIIVVDDSTDRTPAIVASFAQRGVWLIHRERNDNGCCGARSLGMKVARGEIVVLANADARPRADFLNRIAKHYRDGADYLVVRSVIANRDEIWGTFTWAEGLTALGADPNPAHIGWCEGFSVRRVAAEKVGYMPGDFKVPFCRDWMFSGALDRAGFTRHVDLSIDMEHVWPDTLAGYWRNQVHRGVQSSPHAYYFRRLAAPVVFARETLKAGRSVLRFVLVVPALTRAARISKHTPNGLRDIPRLLLAMAVSDAATIVGNFKGWLRVVQAEGLWSRFAGTASRRTSS
jgi:glycosyltransferase involved in cell wall biosynthesis